MCLRLLPICQILHFGYQHKSRKGMALQAALSLLTDPPSSVLTFCLQTSMLTGSSKMCFEEIDATSIWTRLILYSIAIPATFACAPKGGANGPVTPAFPPYPCHAFLSLDSHSLLILRLLDLVTPMLCFLSTHRLNTDASASLSVVSLPQRLAPLIPRRQNGQCFGIAVVVVSPWNVLTHVKTIV